MREIVDYGDASGRDADQFEPPRQSIETRQSLDRGGDRDAGRGRPGNRRERVGEIVPPRQRQPQRMFPAVVAIYDQRRLPHRPRGDRAGDHADLRLFLVDPEGDRLARMGQQRERLGIVGIDHRDSAARQIVAEQLTQFLHALVVEADVEQHADRGAVERDRAVALVDLADIEALPADHRAGERAFGRDEIGHHRAVHDRRFAARGVKDPSEHPGDRGLPAGAGDREASAAGVEQDGIELGAGEPQAVEILRPGDLGHGVLHRRRGHHDLVARDDPAAVLRVEREALPLESGEFFGRMALVETAVGPRHHGAAPAQDLRQRQHPRSADSDEKEGAGQQLVGGGKIAHPAIRY